MLIRFLKIKRRHREHAEIFYAKLDIPALAIRMGSVGGFLPRKGVSSKVAYYVNRAHYPFFYFMK